MANYNDVALASANLEIEYLRRQYNDLKKEFSNVERAKGVLRRQGFFVDNLWHINDVFNVRECDDDQAMQVLKDAFSNEFLTEDILDSISSAADFLNLPLKH
jgi:hypothetical protein